jgi:hypothetical protein
MAVAAGRRSSIAGTTTSECREDGGTLEILLVTPFRRGTRGIAAGAPVFNV